MYNNMLLKFNTKYPAKKVGVRKEAFLYLEKGRHNPSFKLAQDLAETLKTITEELFVFEDDGEEKESEGGEM
jgi:DNA-binding XRE family transcriptional regulator